MNMISVAGNISANDWEDQDAELLAARVINQIEPGGIIVLHDGEADIFDGSEQGNRLGTVAATRLIINELRALDYRIVTVGELLGSRDSLYSK